MNLELFKTLVAAGVPAAEAVKLASEAATAAPAEAAPAAAVNASARFEASAEGLVLVIPAAELAKASRRLTKPNASGKVKPFRYVRMNEDGTGFPLYEGSPAWLAFAAATADARKAAPMPGKPSDIKK